MSKIIIVITCLMMVSLPSLARPPTEEYSHEYRQCVKTFTSSKPRDSVDRKLDLINHRLKELDCKSNVLFKINLKQDNR